MTTRDAYIQKLLDKYVHGTITQHELDQLFDHIREYGVPDGIDEWLREDIQGQPTPEIRLITERVASALRTRLSQEKQIPASSQRRFIGWRRPYAAVSIGLLLLAGLIWYMSPFMGTASFTESELAASADFIGPAGNKASLLLPDGRRILLDENRQGIISDGQRIVYQGDQGTVTALSDQPMSEQIVLSTPRGGTYQVTLPDGTEVWLNAASTLTYPTHFNADERIVYLEGEAYFDVQQIEKSGKLMVFKVITPQQTIEVLGTEFNVTAYADENSATTLIAGKVGLVPNGGVEQVILLPGEQGLVEWNQVTKSKVDVRDYVDWKNGEFVFRNERTDEVFQRLARWYDIDVEYQEESVLKERFSGTISRYGHLRTVLEIMAEAGDLSFDIIDRKVVIAPQKGKEIKNNIYE